MEPIKEVQPSDLLLEAKNSLFNERKDRVRKYLVSILRQQEVACGKIRKLKQELDKETRHLNKLEITLDAINADDWSKVKEQEEKSDD